MEVLRPVVLHEKAGEGKAPQHDPEEIVGFEWNQPPGGSLPGGWPVFVLKSSLNGCRRTSTKAFMSSVLRVANNDR